MLKLQSLAFYAEAGDFQQMQKILDKEDTIEKKNVLLQPIFRELKGHIRHMTTTEEYKILKEYVDNRNLILASGDRDSLGTRKTLNKLKVEYAKLLRSTKVRMQDPSLKLKMLQKRLEDTFNLISIWTNYIDIIYMPDSEMQLMNMLMETGTNANESQFRRKLEDKEFQDRLKAIYGSDEKETEKKEKD